MNRPPALRRASINTRPTALAGCAVLAAMLNAGAIGLATEASSPWSNVTASKIDNPHRTAMMLVAGLDAWPEPDAITKDVGPAITSTRAPGTHRRLPASPPTVSTAPAAVETESPQQVLFYPFREVDSPAFPESDWNLDVDLLDHIGVQRLVFEVLVNDRGVVVGCTVLEPSNLADDVKRDLEKRLSETPLLPARRAGQLVASVRRIELLVAFTPPELPDDPSAHHP